MSAIHAQVKCDVCGLVEDAWTGSSHNPKWSCFHVADGMTEDLDFCPACTKRAAAVVAALIHKETP